MVLIVAVLAGLIAGWVRAWLAGRSLQALTLRWVPLALLAYLPQYLAFGFPLTRRSISDNSAAGILVSSQVLLLGFAWANRRRPGFWLLGLGLLLNFTAILANGGLMPISPETISRLAEGAPGSVALSLAGTPSAPDAGRAGKVTPPGNDWATLHGERLGSSKDVLLPLDEMRLPLLADRFVFPAWVPVRVAFSLGDMLIAAGAFWLLFALGARESIA